MKALDNEVLVETYLKAVDLGLEQEFILMLYEEIKRRHLEIQDELPIPS
jgi:developmental checkpoint coupling sporulation initiation to replication initiation